MAGQQVKWRLPEHWSVTRSDGATVRFDLNQDGDTIAGTAQAAAGGESEQSGIMSGSTIGDAVEMTVYWPAGAVADYRGSVDGDGRMSGSVSDRSDDGAAINWQADEAATRWD